MLKLGLALASLAGLSAAVAVPMVNKASNSSGGNATDRANSSLKKASPSSSLISLVHCDAKISTDSDNSIFFSTDSVEQVCGKSDNSSSISLKREQVTEILKRSWGNPESGNNLNIEEVKSYCDTSSSAAEERGSTSDASLEGDHDSITLGKGGGQSCSGTEYLKLGSDSNAFLKKQKEGSGNIKIGLCDSNCGKGDRIFSETSPTQSLQEDIDKGKELSFQKISKN